MTKSTTTRCWWPPASTSQSPGYHVTYVFPDEEADDPSFAYTVGLWENFAHPELLLHGHDREATATIMLRLASDVRGGVKFTHGQVDRETFNRSVAFVAIADDQLEERFVVTRAVYDHDEFTALQVITPDEKDRFPWDDGYRADERNQRLLGPPPG